MNKLYVVIPCYNEEQVLPETAKRLTAKLQSMIDGGIISDQSKIVFVNDGSKDQTWNIIQSLHQSNPMVQGIRLSRNRGHQNALLAGLMTVKADADMVISMDADLQDDIDAIDRFVDRFVNGFDIVYGIRSSRKKDSFFKKFTAQCYYKFLKLLGIEIVYNHADYRLMSKRALDALEQFKETNLFLRGLVPLIGFPSCTVEYERNERFAGKSKYPLRKMLSLAFDGITSFSIKPIRLITAAGFAIFSISLIMLIYFLAVYFMGKTVPGWTTLAISLWAIGGLQILATGIIGEYIGKIYMETKSRPKYIIEQYIK